MEDNKHPHYKKSSKTYRVIKLRNKIKQLQEDNKRYKVYRKLETFLAKNCELTEKSIKQRLFEAEVKIKELEDLLIKLNIRITQQSQEKYELNMDILKLNSKLQLAKQVLKYYADSKLPDDLYTVSDTQGAIYKNNFALQGPDNIPIFKVLYDKKTAQEALDKISDKVQNTCENCDNHYTDYDCLHDFCSIRETQISLDDFCERWRQRGNLK